MTAAAAPLPVNAGGITAVSEDALETALMGAFAPASPKPSEPPPPPAAGDPDEATAPPPSYAPGQTTDPAGTPAEDAPTDGEPPAEGEGQTVLSQTGDSDLDAALAGLTPAMRTKVVEVSQALAAGTLKPGEIPRIGQLLAERHEMADTITTLQKENEQLRSNPPERGLQAASTTDLPESVAKLKSVGEVRAAVDLNKRVARAINKHLQLRSADAPETVYDTQTGQPANVEADGKRYRSKEQLVDELERATDELEALPQREAQIAQGEQIRSSHAQLQGQLLKRYPHLTNPEHAETQVYRTALALPVIAQHPGGPLIAYKLARGHAIVQAEMAAANGNGKPVFGTPPRPGTPLRGKVPLGKPSAPAGGAAPPKPGKTRFNPPKPGDKVTESHLENALLALPRRK